MPELRGWPPRSISSRKFWWRRLWRLDHWETSTGSARIIGWIVIYRRFNRFDGLRIGPFEWKRGRGWFRWTRW